MSSPLVTSIDHLNYDPSMFPFVFLISVGASLATSVGAMSVWFACIRDPKFLSLGMALSAGVMLYISLHEMLDESMSAFSSTFSPALAYLFGTLSFFGGALITVVLEYAVHRFQHDSGLIDDDCLSTIVTPSLELGPWDAEKPHSELTPPLSRSRLFRTSLITGLVIAFHNLPEGMATFVSSARSLSVGLPLTVAIALHNIPEGIAVAVPILFSTGSRWKGFFWGTASGLTQPLGAAIGWVILANTPERNLSSVYGTLFGLISGIMTYISVAELIPTALQYHKNQQFVAMAIFMGMSIMATSLVLFKIADEY